MIKEKGNTINQEVVNSITNQTNQAVWHDADKVFPAFDKKILGYYEVKSRGVVHRIYEICKLLSIQEDSNGKQLCYWGNWEQLPLLFWTELSECPFTSKDKEIKKSGK